MAKKSTKQAEKEVVETTEDKVVETTQEEAQQEPKASKEAPESKVEEATKDEVKDSAEAKEEPKAEEPAKEESKPDVDLEPGYVELADILSSSDSLDDKLAKIRISAKPEYVALVSRMLSYVSVMQEGTPTTPSHGARANYDLFVALRSALNGEYGVVKPKLDIIVMMFNQNTGKAFEDVRLTRYDTYWAFGKEELKAYNTLVVALAMLANPKTREKNAKLVALQPTKALPDTVVNNLNKYFNLV
jgi:hypothetical protein|nr:MAG TPA: hypothetical protein [Caudoviricetes sp.]